MIIYDGRQQPCIGQRQEPPHCANFARFRAETDFALVHVCADCARNLRGSDWTLTELTGRDELAATPLDPMTLMRETPWVLEIDGVKNPYHQQ